MALTWEGSTRPTLFGRQREQDSLAGVLRDITAGHSRVLVLRGDPGTGKTALLDDLARQATGCRILRVAGVEPESGIAWSALQMLCAPLRAYHDRLPGTHRETLATAFGLSAGFPPGPAALAMAVLGLLAEAAADQPLLCMVDDAHWLDPPSASVLALLAGRLDAESVATRPGRG